MCPSPWFGLPRRVARQVAAARVETPVLASETRGQVSEARVLASETRVSASEAPAPASGTPGRASETAGRASETQASAAETQSASWRPLPLPQKPESGRRGPRDALRQGPGFLRRLPGPPRRGPGSPTQGPGATRRSRSLPAPSCSSASTVLPKASLPQPTSIRSQQLAGFLPRHFTRHGAGRRDGSCGGQRPASNPCSIQESAASSISYSPHVPRLFPGHNLSRRNGNATLPGNGGCLRSSDVLLVPQRCLRS